MQHAIKLIADSIGRIDQIAATIAAAVKERSVVTKEIVRSVQQAPGARSGTSAHTCAPARSIARQSKNPRAFLQRGF
jgi:methyl-accepting chemotaxis protein